MATRERVTLDSCVVDASIAVAWTFPDESNADADALLDEISNGDRLGFVPQHWHLEVRNAALMGERRGRIDWDDAALVLQFLNGIPLTTDDDARLDAALDLARRYDLTIYDAVYLELALRAGFALATLDAKLRRAASQAGVTTLT